jgi:hypothetical protein
MKIMMKRIFILKKELMELSVHAPGQKAASQEGIFRRTD